MTTDKKNSVLIERQFPAFARDDGDLLVSFTRAYYEWAEQANNAVEVSKNLLNYQDLDNTYDKYLEYFHREILESIPRDILSDRKLLAKHIKDVYRSRGGEQSYRLLFRALYGEEIDFYYPGEDILRASDGRWVVENSIRVGIPRTGNVESLSGERITGDTSSAKGRVERIISSRVRGVLLSELFLTDISGTFRDGEIVRNTANTVTATIGAAIGPMIDVLEITQGGGRHSEGDHVSFTGLGTGANGVITSTVANSSVEWNIVSGGDGYTTNSVITITHGSGFDTSFVISTLKDTENLVINTDRIGPMGNVVINTLATFVSTGANTSTISANLAASNANTVMNEAFANATFVVGTINTISTTDVGYDYASIPTATVENTELSQWDVPATSPLTGFKGNNAVITSSYIGGSISKVTVDNFGLGYDAVETVQITNLTRSGTQNAVAVPIVSGVVEYPGRYIDTKGWLSWNNKLQDNYYYQEFSYEIGSDKNFVDYEKIIRRVLHPAGTKMFGRVSIDLGDLGGGDTGIIPYVDLGANFGTTIYVTLPANLIEAITLRDESSATAILRPVIIEEITPREILIGTIFAGRRLTEGLQANSSQSTTMVTAAQGMIESLQVNSAIIGVVKRLIIETLQANDTVTATRYQFTDAYVEVDYSNTQIGSHDHRQVGAFYSVPISGMLDHTQKLVYRVKGAGSMISNFANGDSVVINPVDPPANTTVFTSNVVWSEALMTLTTSYSPLTSNAFLQKIV